MINGSQTGKRQSSYRHNIHVNCWYNVSVTLGNHEDVHDDVLSILVLLLRIFLWKPTGISYFCLGIKNNYSPLAQSKLSSCYHMSQQKKPLIVSELFSRKSRLTTKCIDLECHLFLFFLCFPRITLSFGPSIEFVFLNFYYTEISA